MKWADDIVLAAASQISGDRMGADLGSSFKSILDTLTHIYLAELVWLRRVQGNGNARLADLAAPPDMNALRQAWPEVHRAWLEWVGSFSPDELNNLCAHRNSAGVESSLPYWQIALHVVNHGSYHRGQVATMLRQSGCVPQGTDLALFYRTR
jgi:uncharacterized damage-inducible protein DinB